MLNHFQPFNIGLYLPSGSKPVQNLRRISVMDIFSGMTKNFHPDGLFSTEIFGKVGDVRRSRVFGYIDLQISVFHPVYFRTLTDLKELYGGIMSGKEYAIYDHQTNDFIKSDPINGETGFKFFLDNFETLKFTERNSAKRGARIKLVEKYKKNPLLDKWLVLPAGLRDYMTDDSGKPTEDEINGLYRKVISISNMIENTSVGTNEEFLNVGRYNLQVAVNSIYDYIEAILEGKGKLIQGKWGRRNIDNSTRNVITPYIQQVKSADDPQFVSSKQTVVGLYQFLRAVFPKAVHLVRNTYLDSVFPGPNTASNLVDPKTLKGVSVHVDPGFYDDWMTTDGLEKQFHRFKVKELRNEAINVGGYYLGLMYNGPDDTFRFMNSIDELPEGLKKEDVHPITFAELFYLSVYKIAPEIPGTVTRYPITGFGSIYPSYIYLKSTIDGLVKTELDEQWNKTDVVAPEYPKMDDFFFDALSPASQHLGRLGGDYDGDTCSLTCYMLDDSKEELKDYLNSRSFYIASDSSLAFSSSNDVIDLVLGNLA